MGSRNSTSSDTWLHWLHGTGTWRVYLRVLVGSSLLGCRPFAQGHWRWNLIFTDLPAFPHSAKLGLQSLREGIRLVTQEVAWAWAWALLEDRPVMTVFITAVWPSLYCHLTHSLTHLQASLTAPGFGSFTSFLGTGCSLLVVMDPFLQQSLQPPRPSSLQILQLRAGPLHSQLGPCHSLSVRKLPQKMDLWDSRRKKCLSPLSMRQRPTREAPKSAEARKWFQEWPRTGRPLKSASYGVSRARLSTWGAAGYLATLLYTPCFMHTGHVHTGE